MSETMVNWLSHSIGMLLIVAFSLPSFVLIWMAKKVAIHRELKLEEVQAVDLVAGESIQPYSAPKKDEIIQQFNRDIFIQKVPSSELPNGEKHLRIQTNNEIIHLYHKDQEDMYIERVNSKGKTKSYWVRSPFLSSELNA
ncbi:YfmQ family protein [Brevibacillus ginsengisoli]|uniref:YfmQ family protein n=1 Tax=Brevibacillus ginsengisoli TaxID=363854 RepID=UPI003CEB2380